ncbi:MAG TPA: YfiR family protein, partial [Gemmatimonadales bacterium]|nr:YfiR family protein [Gemmatimonadales bacterium]
MTGLRRLAVWIVALAAAAAAHSQEAPETTVKAAFLYKFAGYVEWPDAAFGGPASPLVIGVIGSDEVAAELERLLPGR